MRQDNARALRLTGANYCILWCAIAMRLCLHTPLKIPSSMEIIIHALSGLITPLPTDSSFQYIVYLISILKYHGQDSEVLEVNKSFRHILQQWKDKRLLRTIYLILRQMYQVKMKMKQAILSHVLEFELLYMHVISTLATKTLLTGNYSLGL